MEQNIVIWNIAGMFLNIVILCVGIGKKTDTEAILFFLYYVYKLSIHLKEKEALGYDFINKVGRFLTDLKLSVISLTLSLLKYKFLLKFVIMNY